VRICPGSVGPIWRRRRRENLTAVMRATAEMKNIEDDDKR
jgi:hypothetical protein